MEYVLESSYVQYVKTDKNKHRICSTYYYWDRLQDLLNKCLSRDSRYNSQFDKCDSERVTESEREGDSSVSRYEFPANFHSFPHYELRTMDSSAIHCEHCAKIKISVRIQLPP